MVIKKNLRQIALLITMIIPLYILLFPEFLSNDIYFEPVWASPINNFTSETSKKPLSPFIVDKHFGYFLSDGTILKATRVADYISASTYAYAEYNSQSTTTQLYTPNNQPISTIKERGFVHIEENRVFLFEPGGNSVAGYSLNGKRLWEYAHSAVLTAFNSSAAGTALGFSDGKLVFLEPDGSERFSFYPGGSNYQIIFGTVISNDGKLLACISGTNPRRVLLIDTSNPTQYKIIYHSYLPDKKRTQSRMLFDDKNHLLFFEVDDGIGIMQCKKCNTHIVAQKGNLEGVGTNFASNMLLLLTRNNNICTLSMLKQPATVLAKTSFPAQDIFFFQHKKSLYLAVKNKIIKIDIKGIK